MIKFIIDPQYSELTFISTRAAQNYAMRILLDTNIIIHREASKIVNTNKYSGYMKVIMSIKPEFAEKIFDGTKKYEFRRAIFKNQEIQKVLVYASSPVKKIIGEFEIENIISLDLLALWNKTSEHSGITKDYFDEYFVNKDYGFAIKIKNIKRYIVTRCIREDYNLIPPQSFLYLRD